MAIEKRTSRTGKVTYRTRLRLNDDGDISATFARKSDAQDWEAKVRGEVRSGNDPALRHPALHTTTHANAFTGNAMSQAVDRQNFSGVTSAHRPFPTISNNYEHPFTQLGSCFYAMASCCKIRDGEPLRRPSTEQIAALCIPPSCGSSSGEP